MFLGLNHVKALLSGSTGRTGQASASSSSTSAAKFARLHPRSLAPSARGRGETRKCSGKGGCFHLQGPERAAATCKQAPGKATSPQVTAKPKLQPSPGCNQSFPRSVHSEVTSPSKREGALRRQVQRRFLSRAEIKVLLHSVLLHQFLMLCFTRKTL